jgi:hypothetical protein
VEQSGEVHEISNDEVKRNEGVIIPGLICQQHAAWVGGSIANSWKRIMRVVAKAWARNGKS